MSSFVLRLAYWHFHGVSYISLLVTRTPKANKVYIGGLPEHTRQEDLQACFGKIGSIVSIELKYVLASRLHYTFLMFFFLDLDMALSYVHPGHIYCFQPDSSS